MTIKGLLLALGMIVCIAAANTENMVAMLILGGIGLVLMFKGIPND